MSFSIYVGSTDSEDPKDVGEALDKAIVAADPTGQNFADYTHETIAAAKSAIIGLVESGVVGRGPYSISLSGHANPGHGPIRGWANDTVTLSITSLEQLKESAT